MGEPVPVTVLTGFLGAGKTTLLNRILGERHGRRYLVIINEFGEIGIDHDLVVTTEDDVVEMNNGCICCTVRADLVAILGRAIDDGLALDGVVVETTGLADPGPVVQTFFVEPRIAERMRLDAVVTVADALNLERQLAASHEAAEQIAMADIVIVNKVDLVDRAALAAVLGRIRAINATCRIETAVQSGVALDAVLDRRAFDLGKLLEQEPDFLVSDHAHEHDGSITSVSLKAAAPIDQERLMAWLTGLVEERGADILRLKGIIDVAGRAERFAIQGVHMLLDGDFQRPWRHGEPRESRLVLIGRGLDAEALAAGFLACSSR